MTFAVRFCECFIIRFSLSNFPLPPHVSTVSQSSIPSLHRHYTLRAF